MSIRTIKLSDGKYEFDVDEDTGLMLEARRNGRRWPEGFDSFRFSKAIMAMLWRISELEDQQAQWQELRDKAVRQEAAKTWAAHLPGDSDGGECD